ncbi:MAG: hydrogenase maturation nickel metallochaperone HypA [Spirochaetota bacterium]|nr:hydrogenase maturation nickel metallochaperone HypA [Spirochaetota bacterium]
MHELSIAMSVVEISVNHAQNANSNKINEIELDIGVLSGVEVDSLKFCFEAACKSTIAEGSELKINFIPAIAECLDCNYVFLVDSFSVECPQCGSFKVNITQGKELKIKSIFVD